MDYSTYHREYYENVYKPIISNKLFYCDCCQIEMKLWNKSQHLKTKKHQLNKENGKPIKKEKYYKECDLEKLKLKLEKLQTVIQELEPNKEFC
jgi:hypothetical protein